MAEITHGYQGLGKAYLRARKGTSGFADFMIGNSGLEAIARSDPQRLIRIAEFGVGSGQQTEFVEQGLQRRGINNYIILAMDKSYNPQPNGPPDQLNVLMERIERGELSDRVIPYHFDIDEQVLPIPSESVDLGYMAFVHHHLANKAEVMREIARITRKGGMHFMFGAALEDLADHPLNEFFPKKYEFDARRYPTREQLKALFEQAGFSYSGAHPIDRDDAKPIDQKFLQSVVDKTLNSVLVMMEKEDPEAFHQGVEKLREVVEEGERTGQHRQFSIFRTVHWGVKQ